MLKFKRIEFDLETGRVLDDASSLECLGGGKGGGTVYVPQPTPAPTPPAPPPPAEAATFETASDVSSQETADKLEANKKGAKSLQIPLTGNTDADKAVGTV
jgi:hypothetical protein